VNNDYWRNRIAAAIPSPDGEALRTERDGQLTRFLDACGTQVRFKKPAGARALDYLLTASRAALDESGVAAEDLDFLIYCGVGRGWIEPAMANIVQAELGLRNATCFDILDACASWLRSLQVAYSYIRSGTYRRGMIVNCECSLEDYLHLDPHDGHDFERRLASFTIGEAATATIVSNDCPDDDFYFSFKTFGEHYGLCMIPLDNAGDYLPANAENHRRSQKFYSHSKELISVTIKKIIEQYRADERLHGREYDVCFSHAASDRAGEIVCKQIDIPAEKYVSTHAQFGNTVSASVPLAISLALQSGRLRRGTRVLTIIGSAGISVGFGMWTH
jgi:3-oxoacyl-[acyl-carrier-protein] synthase III